jgi:hypothetical protein
MNCHSPTRRKPFTLNVIPRRGVSRDQGISGPTQWSAPTDSTVSSRGGASVPARINEIARSSRAMTVIGAGQ